MRHLEKRWYRHWYWGAYFCVAGLQAVSAAVGASPLSDRPVRTAGANAPAVERELTLIEAKELAFARNWDLLAAQSNVDLATAQRIVAREFPNPNLALSTTKVNVDRHPSGTGAGNDVWARNYDSIAAVSQLFEVGGKRSSRKMSAAAGYQAASARLKDARRILDQGVSKAYIAAVLAEENGRILRESAGSLRKEATIAENRFRAGDISAADKSQIDITAERLELDAQAAQAAARSAKISLGVLLGNREPISNWKLADGLDRLATPAAGEPSPGSEWKRPDLVAAEQDAKKAEADLRLQRALRYPDPTVFVQYEHEPADQPNTIGLGLSFPLPLWNRNRGGIMAAEAARSQAELEVEKAKAQIQADIATARIAYEEATARLGRQRQEIEPKSAQIRQTISFSYQKGGASLLDLLLAERSDNEVRLATAQAAADLATARAALDAALNISTSETKKP